MGAAGECHFLCLRAFSHQAHSFWCRLCCITMDHFFLGLSSLMDDHNLYSLDLDSIQLFPEVERNFQPVQLFPDIEPPPIRCPPFAFQSRLRQVIVLRRQPLSS